ncbi:MAG: UDP-glucose 4-epimerase GalE [Bacteroidota bacterium]|nr:UDP-glucose 4-epimerase GalE [Bacteroidota bacterium]
MVVLVTGGAGYVGSHTCVALAEAGHEVIIVDNLCNSERLMVEGVAKLIGKSIGFYEVDICDEKALDAVFVEQEASGSAIESIIHFAALKSVRESIQKPDLYHSNNVGGTETLLKVMQNHGVENLVFSSSCTVYGQPEVIPVDEQAPFLPAESPYGQTKQDCEHLISEAGINSAILRYFNPIGAHSSGTIGELPIGIPNNLIPYLCQTVAGLRNELTVFGDDYPTDDGSCIRDYLHVCDLADAHVAALEKMPKGLRAFNVGTGSGTSVLEIISEFEKVTGEIVPHKIGERRKGDIVAIWANPSRALEELGWSAKRGVGESLADAWRWQQSLI